MPCLQKRGRRRLHAVAPESNETTLEIPCSKANCNHGGLIRLPWQNINTVNDLTLYEETPAGSAGAVVAVTPAELGLTILNQELANAKSRIDYHADIYFGAKTYIQSHGFNYKQLVQAIRHETSVLKNTNSYRPINQPIFRIGSTLMSISNFFTYIADQIDENVHAAPSRGFETYDSPLADQAQGGELETYDSPLAGPAPGGTAQPTYDVFAPNAQPSEKLYSSADDKPQQSVYGQLPALPAPPSNLCATTRSSF